VHDSKYREELLAEKMHYSKAMLPFRCTLFRSWLSILLVLKRDYICEEKENTKMPAE
jgi:hypothetical protein